MFDVEAIVGAGIIVVAAVIFAESGLLIGFFLPGDTLLFAAGLVSASQGGDNLIWLIVITSLAAIIGDNVGYSIGRRAGPRIFKKKDGILFHQDHLRRAEAFYEKHGGKTVTIARFVPIVRTFAPVVAGAGKMPRKRFMFYNITGGIFWCTSMILLGYWLGNKIPGLDHYIEYVLIGVVVLSIGLSFLHVLREPKTRAAMMAGIKNQLSKLALNKKVD